MGPARCCNENYGKRLGNNPMELASDLFLKLVEQVCNILT